MDEEPERALGSGKKELKGEFVVTAGDFIGVRTPDGIKTHM